MHNSIFKTRPPRKKEEKKNKIQNLSKCYPEQPSGTLTTPPPLILPPHAKTDSEGELII